MTQQQLIVAILEVFPQVEGIYLFGSRAGGYARPESDWDVGLLFPHQAQPEPMTFFDGQVILTGKTGANLDLLNLRTVDTVMQFQVITTGQRIFCRDELACALFEMYTYSRYQYLQEERKDILSDILHRKSVYG